MGNESSVGRLLGIIKWSLLRHKYILPMFTLIQIVLSVAMIFGLALMMGGVDEISSIYLATGTVSVGIISVGCSLCSQVVSEAKINGIFDYQKSLPIYRPYIIFADTLIWGIATLPGIVVSLVISVLKFELKIRISLAGIFVILLFLITVILMGFAIAYFLPPSAVSMIAQLIMIGNLLFSPITFPASRLPDWAVSFFNILPFVPATDMMRALLFGEGDFYIGNILVVLVWAIICFAMSLYALTKRN